jgi:hypothetical protein
MVFEAAQTIVQFEASCQGTPAVVLARANIRMSALNKIRQQR